MSRSTRLRIRSPTACARDPRQPGERRASETLPDVIFRIIAARVVVEHVNYDVHEHLVRRLNEKNIFIEVDTLNRAKTLNRCLVKTSLAATFEVLVCSFGRNIQLAISSV